MPPPPLFASIPSEVLELIAVHLDQPTSLSFSRLSARCAAAAEPYLWREIRLTAKEADKEILQRKAKSLMKAGTERRWDMVRTIRAVLARSSLHTLFHILDLSSHCLTSLHIAQAQPHDASNAIDDFDLRLLYCGPELRFPSLTHLRLIRVIHQLDFIPYLLFIVAPNLVSLDLDIDNESTWTEGYEARLDPTIPKGFQGESKLERLRLSFFGRRFIHPFDGNLRQIPWDVTDTRNCLHELLRVSPSLRQLSLDYELADPFGNGNDEEDYEDGYDCFLVQIALLDQMRDLRWAGSWDQLPKPRRSAGFPALERLLLDLSWTDDIQVLPTLPGLHTIIFDCSSQDPAYQSIPSFLSPSLKLALDPELARWLRACGQLQIFHFTSQIPDADSLAVFSNLDNLEISRTATGTIHSVRHGVDEILIVRLLLQDLGTPSSETLSCDDRGETKFVWRRVLYMAGDGENDAVAGVIRLEPVVEVFTDLEGMPVPLEILEKMREVEGLSEEDWGRRGLEVGDAAWRVLECWRDGSGQ